MVERAGESDPAGAGRDVKSRVAGTSVSSYEIWRLVPIAVGFAQIYLVNTIVTQSRYTGHFAIRASAGSDLRAEFGCQLRKQIAQISDGVINMRARRVE